MHLGPKDFLQALFSFGGQKVYKAHESPVRLPGDS